MARAFCNNNMQPVRRYNRTELLRLRYSPLSLRKPEGCEDLNVILDDPIISKARHHESLAELSPDAFTHNDRLGFDRKPGSPPLHLHADKTAELHKSQKRWIPSHQRSNGSHKSAGRRPDSPTLQLHVDRTAELHKSQKRWIPSHQRSNGCHKSAGSNKSLEAEIRSILNKLTPTNLDRMAEKMNSLQVETYDDLQVLAETFFDKVVLETKFVDTYVSLTKMLLLLHVPPPNKNITPMMATFLHLIVAKCQKMFEAEKSVIFEDPKTVQQSLEKEIPEDDKNREETIEKQLYQMKLQRLRFVGNIRYTGELYNSGILTPKLIMHCIRDLLSASDEDSLMCLCQLLTTVGSKLDETKAKKKMDVYFEKLEEISKMCKPKQRFAIKDVMDLRNNSWVPRTQTTSPVSLDQVRKEFVSEQGTEEDWDKEILQAALNKLNEEDWDREIQEATLRVSTAINGIKS